jgi:hypothetical protein
VPPSRHQRIVLRFVAMAAAGSAMPDIKAGGKAGLYDAAKPAGDADQYFATTGPPKR